MDIKAQSTRQELWLRGPAHRPAEDPSSAKALLRTFGCSSTGSSQDDFGDHQEGTCSLALQMKEIRSKVFLELMIAVIKKSEVKEATFFWLLHYLYYIILYYIILYYIILYYIILYYIILYHIILYYMISYYIILYYVMLCYVILYYYCYHYFHHYYYSQ